MRRSSFTGVAGGGGNAGEPLIVVEEPGGIIEEEEEEEGSKSSSTCESPTVNQYLLTPYRDLRKRSLPTPSCTSGITASQVRRLSERGGDCSGPSPIEQAFLATLSQAPAPQPGARRHSVVTISRVPPSNTLFGRNRRESIATFAAGLPRRDSGTFQSRGSLSRQGSQSGSSFNLQLDIMDDIAEVRAKGKRKASWAPGTVLDETLKEEQKTAPRRRASELPSLTFSPAGIVCTNTDLQHLLSPLTSSASEVGAHADKEVPTLVANPNTGSPTQPVKSVADKRKNFLKDRSSSFDAAKPCSNWFSRRHQPILFKKNEPKDMVVTFVDEKARSSVVEGAADNDRSVKCGDKSSAVIDPQLIGSAIEVYLNRRSSQSGESPKQSPTKIPRSTKFPWQILTSKDENNSGRPETCQPSICSVLKDLFVK